MTWAFLDDRANEHDKQVAIGGAACWYWTCGLMYCRRKENERRARRERLDFIPEASALVLYPDPKARRHVAELVRVNLWEVVDGGYLVHDYADVYGRTASPADQQAPPAADQQNQLTPSQLAARRQGGLARAATASRGPAARFQQSSSKAPASRASGSGSGSGEIAKEIKPVAEEPVRSSHARTTAGHHGRVDRFVERATEPGAAPQARHDPLGERFGWSEWFPSKALLEWARTILRLTDRDVDDTLVECRDKLLGIHDVGWFDVKVVRFFEVAAQRKRDRGKPRDGGNFVVHSDPATAAAQAAADELFAEAEREAAG